MPTTTRWSPQKPPFIKNGAPCPAPPAEHSNGALVDLKVAGIDGCVDGGAASLPLPEAWAVLAPAAEETVVVDESGAGDDGGVPVEGAPGATAVEAPAILAESGARRPTARSTAMIKPQILVMTAATMSEITTKSVCIELIALSIRQQCNETRRKLRNQVRRRCGLGRNV